MNNCEVKIVTISNIVFEPYFYVELKKVFNDVNQQIKLTYIKYEEYENVDTICIIQEANIVFVALNFEELYPNYINDIYSDQITSEDVKNNAILRCRELYLFLKEQTPALVVWLGFEDFCYQIDAVVGTVDIGYGIVDSTNVELIKLISNQDPYIDLKRLIAKVGIVNAYFNKGKYRWNSPYSKKLISSICSEVFKQYLIHIGNTKKCIVLDCDNVLWGGIISEDGIDNIHLGGSTGREYQEFQRFLLTLYYHGVILTVCSKNDEEDILRVFNEHSGMILKKDHISCFKVNWENKAENIKRIAVELNIGLDSIVFIDDSCFEIQSVKAVLPEVTVILFDRKSIYNGFNCFNLVNKINITEVEQRNETYKNNAYRDKLRKQCISHDTYLQLLETKIEIHTSTQSEIARISELTQRTNKCTLGIRYTVNQLKQKIQNSNYKLYSIYVTDKFSDLGLVGAIGLNAEELDFFSLSCRALGRNIEEKMLDVIRKNNINSFRFISTQKNNELYNKLNSALNINNCDINKINVSIM